MVSDYERLPVKSESFEIVYSLELISKIRYFTKVIKEEISYRIKLRLEPFKLAEVIESNNRIRHTLRNNYIFSKHTMRQKKQIRLRNVKDKLETYRL